RRLTDNLSEGSVRRSKATRWQAGVVGTEVIHLRSTFHRLSRRAFLRSAASVAGTAGFIGNPEVACANPISSSAHVYKHGAPGYEDLRCKLVWQAIKPPRFPNRIVEVTWAAEIPSILASARAEKRRVSTVSCGHNYVGTGIHDGAVLIYLGNLQQATVDAVKRTASVQPGVRAYPFDALLHRSNLAF